mmetsp:Transcript_78257/g.162533  ORF Transcript_78257/g.162533 Transcript_78257/m.162533 type:complete len:257 (+) Transcript_78257:1585-2355(+)
MLDGPTHVEVLKQEGPLAILVRSEGLDVCRIEVAASYRLETAGAQPEEPKHDEPVPHDDGLIEDHFAAVPAATAAAQAAQAGTAAKAMAATVGLFLITGIVIASVRVVVGLVLSTSRGDSAVGIDIGIGVNVGVGVVSRWIDVDIAIGTGWVNVDVGVWWVDVHVFALADHRWRRCHGVIGLSDVSGHRSLSRGRCDACDAGVVLLGSVCSREHYGRATLFEEKARAKKVLRNKTQQKSKKEVKASRKAVGEANTT